MEIRATSLASMIDIEKSVKELVTKKNLRLVGLLAPHQDVRETTAGSATSGEVLEQHHDVSQTPRRRTTGVTIRESSSTLRAAAAAAPSGKGKKKVSEHPAPILESSNDNAMSTEDLFELYSKAVPTAPLSKKKGSRPHRGESSKNSPTKKDQIGDPPMPVPSWETTPPSASLDQTSPPIHIDQTPPAAPADQTPPPVSIDQTPPAAPADQTPPPGMLTMTASWRRSGALTAQYEKRLSEQLKAPEDKHAEELKASEARGIEELKMAEHQATLLKAIKTKEKCKEASLLNFKKASKLQDDLIISRKETEGLEEHFKELKETNASNLERYKGATFNCFYVFWKHNREADFSYLFERLRQSQINRCLAQLEEEERAKVPASPEISLATGIDGMEEEVGASVDQ
ncbi:uncharacterized protein LOC133832526 [Humulus lupulus]|uniref:uncharacterized protein LOC133832526 n=1 Tax=Humulus lupulus TaxID=3486 RepID=UPI002B408F53|nr:uncharacterized protein LOC133832526 [Humulus lupulus]